MAPSASLTAAAQSASRTRLSIQSHQILGDAGKPAHGLLDALYVCERSIGFGAAAGLGASALFWVMGGCVELGWVTFSATVALAGFAIRPGWR